MWFYNVKVKTKICNHKNWITIGITVDCLQAMCSEFYKLHLMISSYVEFFQDIVIHRFFLLQNLETDNSFNYLSMIWNLDQFEKYDGLKNKRLNSWCMHMIKADMNNIPFLFGVCHACHMGHDCGCLTTLVLCLFDFAIFSTDHKHLYSREFVQTGEMHMWKIEASAEAGLLSWLLSNKSQLEEVCVNTHFFDLIILEKPCSIFSEW